MLFEQFIVIFIFRGYFLVAVLADTHFVMLALPDHVHYFCSFEVTETLNHIAC